MGLVATPPPVNLPGVASLLRLGMVFPACLANMESRCMGILPFAT
jgi:hypothetical protein